MRANSSALAGIGSLGHWGLFFLSACTRHASGHCVHVLTRGHPRIYWQPSSRGCLRVLGPILRAIIHEPAVKAHKRTQSLSCDSRTTRSAFRPRRARSAPSTPPLNVNKNASSHRGLTQNMRLKANIRCLTHVSPPDSAAMAVLDHTCDGFCSERGQAQRSRPAADQSGQNEVICKRAGTDTCVVLCASVVVRPHIKRDAKAKLQIPLLKA